MNKSNYWN